MFDCKPLEFVWQKFPGVYTPENTIMMDDLRRNYILNPQVQWGGASGGGGFPLGLLWDMHSRRHVGCTAEIWCAPPL